MLVAFAPIAGHHIVGWLAIGLIAGLVAGMLVKGGGFGVVGDIVAGLIGAVVGGLVYHAVTGVNTSPSFAFEIVIAFVGAVIVLLVQRSLVRGRHL